MESIYGSVVLRPTRIGFLVGPTQQNFSKVREIIRMCTCLWGGMFNPIIPICRTLPPAWRADHFREISGKGLADAYIRFFEPDVFVEAEVGLAKEAGITETKRFLTDRVISLRQFIQDDQPRRSDFAFGLSTIDIYRQLYQDDFKFASRKRRQVAIFQDDDPFCEAVFGSFPHAGKLAHVRSVYSDVCEPEAFPANASSCMKILNSGYLTPLSASNYKLDRTFKNRSDPTVFIFDPAKTVDLIDFWNLRQFRSNLLPVNLHWANDFGERIRRVVTDNFRPLPGNEHGVMISTTVEFGRSIDQATKNALTQAHLMNLPAGSVSRKDWYDPIWRTNWREGGIQPRRIELRAEELEVEETVDEKDPMLRIPSPAPKFARKYSFVNNHARWANVIKFSDSSSRDSRLALTFPPNVKGGDFPALDLTESSLCTREGIVLLRQYKSQRATLRLMSEEKAVIGWFASLGIKATPSSSGRNAEQVLRSVGGTSRCRLFANEATIKLLDKMAKTIQRELDGTTAQYADRTASVAEWREVLGRRSKSLFSLAKLSDFTEHNVMRVGLSLTCPLCAKENWYSLAEVNYELACERCLNKFSFPQAGIKFNEGDWRYRVLGPFSVPNYADGAYATVLTLRLLKGLLYSGSTPTVLSTGLDVVLGESKFEIDFAGWYSEGRKFWIDPSPVIVFGEAKSFGADVFKERDVQRLKTMAEHIPGSYVVFSALKNQLSDAEKSRIRKVAEWGRVPQKNGVPRAMIIILTGTELFADHYLKQTWKEAGSAHAAKVSHASVHIDDLWTLADITQQLYLDMPPYWESRTQRLKQASAPRAAP